MKSAVFYGKKDLRIEEYPMPQVKENDVLIKVMACGICGTDIHIFEGDKGAADTTPPTILGHEFAGIVEEVGSNVTNIRIGDRVCVDPNVLCGDCYYCKSGIGHFCTGITGIGTTVDGGFSQYCCVPAKQVYQLADTTPFEAGAMTEPLACCLHGIDMCDIEPGNVVVVIGGGMIGLLMVQLSKLKGAHNIILIEPISEKRNLGRQLGADLCIDPTTLDIKSVLEEMGISRVHTVIECVGLPATINQALDIAGNKSIVMMFGLTKPDDTVSINPFKMFQKEIVLKASFINPYTQGRALDLINSGKIDVSSMIYATESLEALPEILSQPERRSKGKYIINPWK